MQIFLHYPLCKFVPTFKSSLASKCKLVVMVAQKHAFSLLCLPLHYYKPHMASEACALAGLAQVGVT